MKINMTTEEINEVKSQVRKKELGELLLHVLYRNTISISYLSDFENGDITEQDFWEFCIRYTNKLKSC